MARTIGALAAVALYNHGHRSVHKHEADGGPALLAIARILRNSERRSEDLRTLLVSQLLFWPLAAPDGHAKNFSIHLLPGGRHRLTPLYDVLSGRPMVGRGPNRYAYERMTLAMALRGRNVHCRRREIQRRHLVETARMCGFDDNIDLLVDQVLAQAPQVVESVGVRLPAGFPEDVFAVTTNGLLDSAQRLHR
jgi:serine/threonine-protein kinase HipA